MISPANTSTETLSPYILQTVPTAWRDRSLPMPVAFVEHMRQSPGLSEHLSVADINKNSHRLNQPNYFITNDALHVCMEKSINYSLWISFTWLFLKRHSSDFHQLFTTLVRVIFLVHCMGTIILASHFNDTKWARQDGVDHKSNSKQGDIFLPFAEKAHINYR